MSDRTTVRFNTLRDQIVINDVFQRACQRYAHGNGSSGAIASAAILATSDHFYNAVALDPEGLIGVIDLARQIWEGDELAEWLLTPSLKFAGHSPLERCGVANGADDVLDFLEVIELDQANG